MEKDTNCLILSGGTIGSYLFDFHGFYKELHDMEFACDDL
jgi:hypothetical protein